MTKTRTSYLGAAKEFPLLERSYLAERFFGNFGDIARTKYMPDGTAAGQISFDLIRDGNTVAPSINFGDRAVETSFSYDTKTVNIRPTLLNKPMNAAFAIQRMAGFTPYSEDPELDSAAAEIMLDHNKMIVRRENMDAIQALRTGCVRAYDASGAQLGSQPIASYWETPIAFDGTGSADSSDPLIAPEVAWDASSAKILRDLEAWQNLMIDNGGAQPDALIVSQEVFNALIDDPKIAQMLNASKMNMGLIEHGEMLGGTIRYCGQLAGLDILVCPVRYKLGGALTALMPKGTAVMAASRFAENKMYYGTNFVCEDGKTALREGRIVSGIYSENNPPSLVVQTASCPLPVVRRKWDALSIRNIIS